ncbi:MAG: hypothetical protein QNJ14_11790 [Woeseiaceae bacterium]|nr:hypothetical protein [Woeseiaceae bacterium]
MESIGRYVIAAAMLAVGGFMSMLVFWISLAGGLKGGDAPLFLARLPDVSIVAIPLLFAASALGVVLSYRQKEHVIIWASLPIFFTTAVYIALETWWLSS